VALFEVADTALRRRWDAAGTAADVAFFARGRRLAVGYESGVIEIREARDGTVLESFKAVEPNLYTVDVDDAGSMLAAVTASAAGSSRVWDLRAHRRVVSFEGFPDAVLSHDADALYVVDRFVGGRNVIEVRDARTGALRDSAPQGLGNLEAVALHPDENALALGDESGNIRVVDAQTGEIKGREWRAGFGPVTDLEFSPSGDRLAAVTAGHLQVWSMSELDPATLMAAGCRRVGRNLRPFEWEDVIGFEADPPAICPGVAPNWFDVVGDRP
jgi:WD40 repeat protein